MRVELRGARVIVGDGSDPDEKSVVVDGESIAAVKGKGGADVSIDLEGRTLVPGFRPS